MSEVIRFNYLSRDSGNWKKFGQKLFSNPDQLTIEEIEQKIRENLIDQEYFYPNQVGIKKFKFHRYLDDYSWYEFESVEILTNIEPTIKELKPISYFLLLLKKMKNFDIYLMGDQPTTCPSCGARTEITMGLRNFLKNIEYHKCLSEKCNYTFIMEQCKNDSDDDIP